MVFEPSARAAVFSECCAQDRAWVERSGDAVYSVRPACVGILGDCPVQPRLFRPAVLVHPGDDSAGRHFSHERCGGGGGAGRLRGRHGRNRFWGTGRLSSRPRLRIRAGLYAGQYVSCDCVLGDSADRPVGEAMERGTRFRAGRRAMKIKEIRTRVVEWQGKTVPLPPHFCTNPMDLLSLPEAEGSMQTFTFHSWLIVEVFTDDGLAGVGNCALAPRVSKQVIDLYLRPI